MRATDAQFGLSVEAREQNVANAFGLGDRAGLKPGQSRVWLVDDIYTTGATIRSAIQVLHHHRITVEGVVVVARALERMKAKGKR